MKIDEVIVTDIGKENTDMLKHRWFAISFYAYLIKEKIWNVALIV